MRTMAELEALAAKLPAAPTQSGAVALVVVRKGGGVHQTPQSARLTVQGGVQGDRWFDSEDRTRSKQVTLMNADIAKLVADDQPLHLPGDNFMVQLDLSEDNLPPGTELRIGTARLAVTDDPHRGCKKFAARFGKDAMRWLNAKSRWSERLRGVHCEVIGDGDVAVGDRVEVVRRTT